MKRLYFGLFAISLVFSTAATAATVADAIKEAEDKEANMDYDGAFAIYSDILQQFPKDFPGSLVRACANARHGGRQQGGRGGFQPGAGAG